MARLTLTLMLVPVLFFALVRADLKCEAPSLSSTELGPVAPSLIEDAIIFQFDATSATGNSNLVGVAFAGGCFWIAGSGQSLSDPADNLLYKLTSAGTLIAAFPQPNIGSGIGFYDLTYDGAYLYGGCCENDFLHAFDLEGQMVPAMNVPKPPGPMPLYGLAYDSTLDHFWISDGNSVLREFDRTGTLINSGNIAATNLRGVAFDYGLTSVLYRLWVFCATGTPQTTMRHVNAMTLYCPGPTYQVPQFPNCGSQTAAGLDITHEFDPLLWTLVGLASGTPNDYVFVWDVRYYAHPQSPAVPDSFQVFALHPEPIATLSWINPILNQGGTTLSGITGVIIKRENVAVDTIPGGLPGQVMVYSDTTPAPGFYHYKVQCVNEYGLGAETNSLQHWVGVDIPAPVNDLKGRGVENSLQAQLTWINPTTGWHGGYFTPECILGYVIKRYNQMEQMEDSLFLPGLHTSYLDSTITVQGSYIYSVVAKSAAGIFSYPAYSPAFQVGGIQYIPIPYNWVEIQNIGVNTGITGFDQNVGPFDLGFTFNYFGTPYTSVRVCSNGFITFTSTSGSHDFRNIPSSEEPNNFIAPLWGYMNPPEYGGHIWYYADYANRRFIVEWNRIGVADWKGWGLVNMEVILHANGYIDFQYRTYILEFPVCVIGLENGDGTQGIQCSYLGSGPVQPYDSIAVRIITQHTTPTDLALTLTPLVSPIQIPANGGSFSYYASLANAGFTPLTTQLWTKEILPDSSVLGPLLGPVTVTVPPGTIAWLRHQNVPASAPSGQYTYIGLAGIYPDTIWSQDAFPFTKLTTGDGPRVDNWDNWGDEFTSEATTASMAVQSFTLKGVHPNPFNSTTSISYELPIGSYVRLQVFDMGGRLVTTLVDGWREAGQHQITFDGSKQASGLYFVKMQAGKYNVVQKLMLLK